MSKEYILALKTFNYIWNEQLGIDGVNSKGMVRTDIQYLIKERTDDSN